MSTTDTQVNAQEFVRGGVDDPEFAGKSGETARNHHSVNQNHRREENSSVDLLLVSSIASFREKVETQLKTLHWHVSEARSGSEALEILHTHSGVEVLLLDPVLPDLLPAEFCGMVRQRFPQIEILTMNTNTGHVLVGSSTPSPVASRLAALFHEGRGGKQEVQSLPSPAIYRRDVSSVPGLRGVVGESAVMQQIYTLTHMVATRDTTVLVTGESGTGKDLIAQAIHMISPRQKAPFIIVNCAAIPEALLEAELFGYAKGAFTGAMQSRIGRIHAAHGGTLFLDEIGDMPLSLQSKILRFVEQGEVQRLGSNENLKVDVRVVAATNAALPTLVEQKQFREDLYYRLAVFPIRLAPLRERGDDVRALAKFFAGKFCPGVLLRADAIEALCRHRWPGNVRELRNVIERASILAGAAREITAAEILL